MPHLAASCGLVSALSKHSLQQKRKKQCFNVPTSFFQVPVLNMVGAFSPFVEETVVLNGKLNPENTNWMKIQVKRFS
jgi:hypothetical protein